MTPANGVRFLQRHLIIPRILDPGCVVIRLHWPTDNADQSKTEAAISAIDSKLPLLFFPRIVCLFLLPEIFVGVPLAYYVLDTQWSLFGLIVLVYTQIIALVVWLFASRRELALTWQSCFVLTFESLVCIPYAINFHRKTAELAASTSGTDLFEIGGRLLVAERLSALRNYVKETIDDRMIRNPEADMYSRSLATLRSRLDED